MIDDDIEVVVPVVKPTVVTVALGVRADEAVVAGWEVRRVGRDDRWSSLNSSNRCLYEERPRNEPGPLKDVVEVKVVEVEEVVLTEEEPNLSGTLFSWFSDIVLVLRNGRFDLSFSNRLLLLRARRGLEAERGR